MKREAVQLPLTFAGRVAAFRDVEIRSQVGGILLERAYEEGARVDQGRTLFRIDRQPYQVALERAEARLAQARASLVQAEQNFRRISELARVQVTTQKQLDDARGGRDQAEATVKLAQAEVAEATLNLGYTTVTAPVAGITSLSSPPQGTLILARQTLLTTISQLDPAYVNFSVTEEDNKFFRASGANGGKTTLLEEIAVELHYGAGPKYPHIGRLDVTANIIDPQTGTVQFRAIFANPDGVILPGQFVRVVIRGLALRDVILIPKQAILQGPRSAFVYVVAANGTAEMRPIHLGRELESGMIVEEGLKAGDLLIFDGVMRVRPGAPVRPMPVSVNAQTSTAGGKADSTK